MSENVFGGIIRHNIPDFHKVNTADYLSALTNDVKMVEDNYLLPLLEIIQNGIIFVGSLVVMFYLDVIVRLDRELLIKLVEKIVVGQKSMVDGAERQEITIIYNHVGRID